MGRVFVDYLHFILLYRIVYLYLQHEPVCLRLWQGIRPFLVDGVLQLLPIQITKQGRQPMVVSGLILVESMRGGCIR